jgi:hypothetical protein
VISCRLPLTEPQNRRISNRRTSKFHIRQSSSCGSCVANRPGPLQRCRGRRNSFFDRRPWRFLINVGNHFLTERTRAREDRPLRKIDLFVEVASKSHSAIHLERPAKFSLLSSRWSSLRYGHSSEMPYGQRRRLLIVAIS